MRRKIKCVLALLCTLIMAGGVLPSENGQVAQANTVTNASELTDTACEWVLIDTAMTFANATTKTGLGADGTGVNIYKPGADKGQYTLHLELNIPAAQYTKITSGTKINLELCEADCDRKEWNFVLSKSNITSSGDVTLEIPWTEAVWSCKGGSSETFNMNINYIRMHSASGQSVTVNNMAVKYTPLKKGEWQIMPRTIITDHGEIASSGTPYILNNFNYNLQAGAGKVTADDLALYVYLNIPSDMYNGGGLYTITIEVNHKRNDNQEYEFTLNRDELKAGENLLIIPWSEASANAADKGDGDGAIAPTLDMDFGYFRMYMMNSNGKTVMGLNGLEAEIKIVDVSPFVKAYGAKEYNLGLGGTEVKTDPYVHSGQNINLEGVNVNDITLIVSFALAEAAQSVWASSTDGRLYVSLSNATYDKLEWRWKLNAKDYSAATNELRLKVVDEENHTYTSGDRRDIVGPNLDELLTYFRVLTTGDASIYLTDNVTFRPTRIENSGYVTKTPGVAPSDIPEGYVFAGWYTDKECTIPLTETTDGLAYAKSVRSDLLTIKGQENYADGDTKADLRLVATVDSLNYREVGFDITINGKKQTKTSTTVYKKLYAIGDTGETISYSPTEIDAVSDYFFTYTIQNIPQTAFESGVIKVQAFWVTQDGTKVLGPERTIQLSEVMK